MQKYKLLQNRLFVYLLCLYIMGLIFGILLINPGTYNLNNPDKNYFVIFFSNYWYIFLIWIFGFTFLGFLVDTIIVFFRAFVFGILVRMLITNDFSSFLIMFLLELFIFFPVLIFISYVSLMMSKENLKIIFNNYTNTININKYINLMLIVTVIIAIYSLIIFFN